MEWIYSDGDSFKQWMIFSCWNFTFAANRISCVGGQILAILCECYQDMSSLRWYIPDQSETWHRQWSADQWEPLCVTAALDNVHHAELLTDNTETMECNAATVTDHLDQDKYQVTDTGHMGHKTQVFILHCQCTYQANESIIMRHVLCVTFLIFPENNIYTSF